MIRNPTIPAAVGLAILLAGPGCRKAEEPPAPAAETPPAIPPDKPGAPLDPTPSTDDAPSGEVGADGTDPQGGEEAPEDTGRTPEQAGSDAPAGQGDPLQPPPGRTGRSACMRACNKSQICGSAGRPVTDCVTACLEALEATGDEARATARAFLAQDRCADQPCEDFASCTQRQLLGERAVSDAKPLEKSAAKEQCHTICEKEKACSPDLFAQRRRTMEACETACGLVMTSDESRAAVQRAMLMKTFACADQPCPDFEACLRK